MTNEMEVSIVAMPQDGGHQQWSMETDQGTLKALETPLAKEYAENLLLQNDMQGALATMECWQRRFASSSDREERLIAASLFRDAIIQFVGCFDKTAQFPLSADEIYGGDPDELSAFQWFKDTRDAYAGHKFGAQRQCVVGVVLKEGQRGVGRLMAIYRGQHKSDGDVMRGFMQTAANHLDTRVDELGKKLEKEVTKLSIEEINKLKDATARTLRMGEARFTRADLNREKPAQRR